MSAEAAAVVRRFAVGPRTCIVTLAQPRKGDVVSCAVEWEPDLPEGLSPVEWRQYRAGRDAAVAALAARLGVTATVFEV